jgi:hypothetical protein
VTYACDREITPWLSPLPSGPRSGVRALRTPGAESVRMSNRLATRTSWDRCLGEGGRDTAHGPLHAAPAPAPAEYVLGGPISESALDPRILDMTAALRHGLGV